MPTPYQLAIQQINQKYSGTTTTSAPTKPDGPIKSAVEATGKAIAAPGQAYSNFMSNLQDHLVAMGKDAVNTLVVNPATRIAQGAVQTYNEFQNPGYDTPVDTGNPQRINAGGTVAPAPINAGVPGVNTSNSEANLNQPQTNLGQIVAPLQSGNTGAKQIAGQALKAGSYLAAPELSEGAVDAPTLAGKIASGAGSGFILGAGGGAGEDLANNPNSNAQSVTQSAQSGAKSGALVGGVLAGVGGLVNGEAPTASETAPVETQTSNQTQPSSEESLSQKVIKNPANLEQAYQDGRITAKGGKSIVEQSPQEQRMSAALKPLEDSGKLKDPSGIGNKAMQNQLENGATVQNEIENTGNDIRNGIKGSKAIWNSNELKGVTNEVNIPDPVKNDATMAKNAASLRKAIVNIGKDATKDGEGTLDVRQNFDKYVKQNYGENFFNKGRNADPLHQYVFSLRDGLNEWSASKLPEGKLPSGENYGDALRRQSQLINASNEMAAKFENEFKGSENQGTIQRWMKANPEKARFLRRAIYPFIGISAAGTLFRKDIAKLATGQ